MEEFDDAVGFAEYELDRYGECECVGTAWVGFAVVSTVCVVAVLVELELSEGAAGAGVALGATWISPAGSVAKTIVVVTDTTFSVCTTVVAVGSVPVD